MRDQTATGEVGSAVLKAMHAEATTLEFEATAWFTRQVRDEGRLHQPAGRAAISHEWLRLSTRLLRIMWWLLSRTEASEAAATVEFVVTDSLPADLELLPTVGQQLIARSLALQDRVQQMLTGGDEESPARDLQQRLRGCARTRFLRQ